MKISLIFPRPPEKGTFCGTVYGAEKYNKEKIEFYGFPPMGILYLATTLSENNYNVSLLDQFARGYSTNQTLDWIKNEDPDILGFSTITTAGTGITSAQIAKEVKEKINPNIKILFGNYHATFNDIRILNKYPFIDACVRGEGEKTILEIADKLEKGKNFEDIRGVTYRNNGKIIKNEDRPLIDNLDELPFPAWHLTNMKEFFKLTKYLQGSHLTADRHLSIITSRSCPYACIFCSVRSIMGRGFRPRAFIPVPLR